MTPVSGNGNYLKVPLKALAPVQSFLKGTLAYRAVRYGYANSRTKAMRATLLSKKETDALIEAKNIQEIIGLLSRTSYSADLVEEGVAFSRADLVEIALTKNFSRTLKKLVKISPKGDSEKIKRVFERYDVLNVKNLLLGVHLKEPKQKIRVLLIESPAFNKAGLNSLAESTSVKELVEKLKNTDYYPPLAGKVLDYEKSREIRPLVSALESHYHKKALGGTAHSTDLGLAVKNMLDAEADAKNMMIVFRGKKEGFEEKKIRAMLIEGGKMARHELEKIIAAKSIEDAAKTQKRFGLSDALEFYRKDRSIVHFENALEQGISKRGLSELRRSVLSLSAIVGFLFLKEKEVSDVRKIVRTKEFGFTPEEIRKLVAP